jgi:sulfoxide reductase catalytic subunit YedY
MLIRKPDDIKSSEITPQGIYLRRREFMRAGSILAASMLLPNVADATARLSGVVQSRYSTPRSRRRTKM